MPRSVLFVCLGNICRSPTAEGVVRARAEARGLDADVHIDSAGTCAHHIGELPDARMRSAASRRGYTLDSRARQITRADLTRFDLIAVMDGENLRDVLALARDDAQRARVRLLGSFVDANDPPDVPDPYYGGSAGFERVLDLIESAADPLLDALCAAER
ncbi:MAG: low molecular weight phosphotyrosine protein phosphatase [Myxococcales bacterium]|nr:low molecular weight phosphotyrosine protein phosphatase [Myxococcales bacterium]